jgi:hypothetical protein
MSEAELEAAVDEMLDLMAAEITPTKLIMSPDAVKQRVIEILKKRGMWAPTKKGGARTRSKKSRRARNKRSRKSRSTRRRRR